ncbi:hypothetical protein SEA_HALEEMA_54 [Mycobacterium phage Haleema]|uniref:Uncharacterized protein n=13 Tax=Pegunavirus TaxID=1623295 RepID=A0A1I9SBG5_9CAUD|nr:hypothetical protein VORTEX_55 [Mycobacterium phage Vortex]ACU41892.1 hypothetical protein PUHLTONIO_55 [Mycobacterium phage Puhltonio]AEJ92770.1 hypothetical protein SEA_SERENDIPITY_55 [Mycobacterium phage Serendipity]AEO94127.1 hypothetical protein MORGUSHI_55 [Mycobacterium phage Morgushi]AER49266.1 hypothetical protein TALLGRASSMM_55 [Mycobacterium phage TallGrassMM]AIM49793.1 hypothetical protein PBI_LASSO_55 [Mycobacterium phage Lasso]ALH46159.1 hypothetical protein SEA_SQUID_55 [Myc
MTAVDLDTARQLIGDGVPSTGALPAAWWISTDPEIIEAYDRWKSDYAAHRDRVDAFVRDTFGGTGAEDAMMWSHGTRSVISGFTPPHEMTIWPGHDDYRPPPTGWRVDSKSHLLVPSRKTKADRESDANKVFDAIKQVPNLGSYIFGLSPELFLDDRGWGGTVYYTRYRRGDNCVWAYSGGDPDRQLTDDRRAFKVAAIVWTRMPLSTLAKLMEEKAERLKTGTEE